MRDLTRSIQSIKKQREYLLVYTIIFSILKPRSGNQNRNKCISCIRTSHQTRTLEERTRCLHMLLNDHKNRIIVPELPLVKITQGDLDSPDATQRIAHNTADGMERLCRDSRPVPSVRTQLNRFSSVDDSAWRKSNPELLFPLTQSTSCSSIKIC